MFSSYKVLALWLLSILVYNYVDINLVHVKYILVAALAVVIFISKQIKFKVLTEHVFLFLLLYLVVGITMPQLNDPLKLYKSDDNVAIILIKKELLQTPYAQRYLCEVKSLHRPIQLEVNANCILILPQEERAPRFYPGDRFYARVRFADIPSAKHKYLFDASDYWSTKGVYSKVWVSNIRMGKPSDNILLKIYHLQAKTKDLLYRQKISEKAKQMISALVLGDKKSVEKEVITSFQSLGLIHVLALSGMHIGLIYGVCLFLLKIFLKNSPRLRAVILIVLVFSYAVFTGLSPSVFRASLMFFIYGVSVIINRPTSSMNIVSLSALILLIYQPNYVFDLGFQLSYLAVYSILYFYRFYRIPLNSYAKWSQFFIGMLFISLSAQLATSALSIYYFGLFPMSFLWANILVLPFISISLYLSVFYVIWIVVIGESLVLNEVMSILFDTLVNWVSVIEKYSFEAVSVSLSLWQVYFYYGLLVLFCVCVFEAKFRLLKVLYVYLVLAYVMFIFFEKKEKGALLLSGNKNGFALSVSTNQKQVVFKDGVNELGALLGDYASNKNFMNSDTISFRESYSNEFCHLNDKILQYRDLKILLLESEMIDTTVLGVVDVLILKEYREDIAIVKYKSLVLDARMSKRERLRIKEFVQSEELIDLAEVAFEKVYW